MSILDQIVKKIRKAHSIVLSTHKQCDGDGLGAQIALYHGLKKMGKQVRILNVDETPRRYSFLNPHKIIQNFHASHEPLHPTQLALIFDTNDYRLVEPLFSVMKSRCEDILFVDHHPVLIHGPAPTQGSVIDTEAASTGEIVYKILKRLRIEMDAKIARALYTSVVFDTHLFRFIRNSATSHLIAAELLQYEKRPDEIHRALFGNQTIQKMAFLAKALANIEYHHDGRIAVLKLHGKDLTEHGLDPDESGDVVDMLMNIESTEAAALFREDGVNVYKVSLRSKGEFEIIHIAESLGGGGHAFSAGAYLGGNIQELKLKVIDELSRCLKHSRPSKKPESA